MRVVKYSTRINPDTKYPKLVKEKAVNYVGFKKMDKAWLIVDMMNELFDMQHKTEEYVYMLMFNSCMDLRGVFEISHGTVNSSLIDPREIFMKALLAGAVSIILVHNHPSGFPEPSSVDLQVTKRIQSAGQLLNVALLDHIVIGDGCYCSMRNENYM